MSGREDEKRSTTAFTTVELVVALAIIGVLSGIATSQYVAFLERAKVAAAISEISGLSEQIEAMAASEDGALPDTLSEAGIDIPVDPWGNPYHYLRINGVFDVTRRDDARGRLPHVAAGPRPPPDSPRKDRFFKPLNTDFDLYSSGPDGISRDSLRHKDSYDDIVRGINGGFVGAAINF